MFTLSIGRGEFYALLGALLWSLFPIITTLALGVLSPLQAIAICSLLSAVFFAIVLTLRRTWRVPSRQCLRDLIIATVLLGIIFYVGIFVAIKYTTPGNAGILLLMEVLFSFLTLNLFTQHEPFVLPHALGGACMVLGVLVLLLPKASGWHLGDLIIIAATAIPPLGSVAMQRARKEVSAEFIMFFRSVVSGTVLLLISLAFDPLPSLAVLTPGFLMVLLINGILLFGVSKILWLEAINLLPITKTISICSITPFFTLIFSSMILDEQITRFQLLSLAPIIIGMALLMSARSRPRVIDPLS
jgi:drug/metabolite transporter (DMT)-like permease